MAADARLSKVFRVVEVQSAMIARFEAFSDNAAKCMEKNNATIAELSAAQSHSSPDVPVNQTAHIFDALRAFVASNIETQVKTDILRALESNDTMAIVSAFKILNETRAQPPADSYRADRDRLYSYLASLVRLFLSVADNSVVNEEIATFVNKSVRGIEDFLTDQIPYVLDSETVVDALGFTSVTPANSLIRTFFMRYSNPEAGNARELLLLLEGSIAVNAVLKKIAAELRRDCDFLALESQKHRGTVEALQNRLAEAELAEITAADYNRFHIKYRKLKARNKRLVREASKRLQPPAPSEEDDGDIELLQQVSDELADAQAVRRELRGEIRVLTEENTRLIGECDGLRDRVNADDEEIRRLRQEMAELQGEVDRVRKYEAELEAAVKTREAEFDIRLATEIRSARALLKGKLKKVKEELHFQVQRTEHAAAHSEKLVEELRMKLREARAEDRKCQEQLRELRAALSESQSKLADNSVDERVTKSTISALEDRLKRTESIRDNQMRARELALASEVDAQVRKARESWESDTQLFLSEIVDLFRSLVAFNHPITRDSVSAFLTDVARELAGLLDRQRKVGKAEREMEQIVSLLGSDAVVPAISQLVSKVKTLEMDIKNFRLRAEAVNRARIEVHDGADRAWNTWGRRLLTIVTGALTLGKSDEEVRCRLEEAVLEVPGQAGRLLWKLESLRAQKQLGLTKGNIIDARPQFSPSLRSLITVVGFVRRAHRLVCCLHADFIGHAADAAPRVLHRKRWPVVGAC
jgi:hypothetical protein